MTTQTAVPTIAPVQTEQLCHHCGKPNPGTPVRVAGHAFCCQGCAAVYDILAQGDLCQYYDLDAAPRQKPAEETGLRQRYAYLESEEIVRELTEFYTPERASITLHIPAMHCAACLWLLENMTRLNPAVTSSRVDFVRKELTLDWVPAQAGLQELVMLLSRIGYEPIIGKPGASVAGEGHKRYMRSLVTKLGVTGFCAGNIMLFSFPDYLGIEADPALIPVFEVAKVALALPVVAYGAADYFKGAWQALRHRQASLDVPLAVGILTLFVRSLIDTFLTHAPGFYDSLAGLVLFLLFGRWVQARSFDHLRFDQQMDDYFPLAAAVMGPEGKRYQKADTLEEGQVVEVLNGMLFPADGILVEGPALVDYSFATGESRPVLAQMGDILFAGGRLQGSAIRMRVTKPMARSRFTRLWSHPAFDKRGKRGLIHKIERNFTIGFNIVAFGLAAGAALYWGLADPSKAWSAATAVLIVACPCALSLAMPFATHAATQMLAGKGMFLRKPEVLQELAGLQAIVFDKTGTLTEARALEPRWEGPSLGHLEKGVIVWMARQSGHPLARAIAETGPGLLDGVTPHAFQEVPGQGLQAVWATQTYRLGSPGFASEGRVMDAAESTQVAFSCNGLILGSFYFHHNLREGLPEMFEQLGILRLQKAVLSGDAAGEASAMRRLLGQGEVKMECTPLQKLHYLEALQAEGLRAAMVGDGMNDAGAFAAAQVGIAVRDDESHFSPACDIILDGDRVRCLPQVIQYARQVMRGVGIAFGISLLFNAVSLGFAVTDHLSAPVAALLMPLGSITVVLTSIGLTKRAARSFEFAVEPRILIA